MKKNTTWLIIAAVVLVTAAIRLLPHPFNFTPVGALALFSGSILGRKKWAAILPFGGLVLSDAIMEWMKPGNGFYPGIAAVYGAFILVTALGFFLRNNRSIGRVIGFSLLSSVLFFLITNFDFWYGGTLYPMTAKGLYESYYMALPFFRNGLLGDLFYNGVFFGSFYLIGQRLGVARQA